MKERSLVFVKLGGSLITDKSKPFTALPDTISRLGREIKYALSQTRNHRLVLAHGSGSFGHTLAKKYGIANGFKDDRGRFGACLTHDAAAQINRFVVKQLLAVGLPVASITPSSMFTARNGKLTEAFFKPIELCVAHSIIPILYGDGVWDEACGVSIFSGEKTLRLVSEHFLERRFTITQHIQCGIEDGVLDIRGNVIPIITSKNIADIQHVLEGSAQADVTGGMRHKVEEALELAKHGVQTIIMSGTKNRLRDALLGKPVVGTRIQ